MKQNINEAKGSCTHLLSASPRIFQDDTIRASGGVGSVDTPVGYLESGVGVAEQT